MKGPMFCFGVDEGTNVLFWCRWRDQCFFWVVLLCVVIFSVAHLFSFLCCVFCFVCLRPVSCVPYVTSVLCLVYPTLPLSCVLCTLRYLCHVSCVPYITSVMCLVYPMLPLSCVLCTLRYLCHVSCVPYVTSVLCLVYPMLPCSLDCPFLNAPSVFSNVYLLRNSQVFQFHLYWFKRRRYLSK
jgi:hypothetical protein